MAMKWISLPLWCWAAFPCPAARASLARSIIGVIFMGVLANGMMMMNINEYWQRVVKGLVLLAAVAVDIRAKNKAKAV